MKFLSFLFSVLFFMGVPVCADALSDDLDRASSGYRSGSAYYGVNGGRYINESQVLNSRVLYQRVRFGSGSFTPFLTFFYEVLAYDLFEQYRSNGDIDDNGVALRRFQIGNEFVEVGSYLTMRSLRELAREIYSEDALLVALASASVLNSVGELSEINTVLDADDSRVAFDYLLSDLESIDLPLANDSVMRGVRRELYQFIKRRHQRQEVTRHETVRYESGFHNNILHAIADQIVGTVLGKLFFRDGTSVDNLAVSWRPGFDFDDYFPDLYMGLNRAPYYNGGDAWLRLNGRFQATYMQAQLLNTDSVRAVNGDVYWHRTKHRGSLSQPELSTGFFALRSDWIHDLDTEADFLYLSPQMGWGFFTDKSRVGVGLGLTYRTSGTIADSVGLNFSVGSEVYPFRPMSIYFDYLGSFQPSFSSGATQWSLYRTSLGLRVHMDRASLDLGYRWVSSEEASLFHGLVLGVGVYF